MLKFEIFYFFNLICFNGFSQACGFSGFNQAAINSQRARNATRCIKISHEIIFPAKPSKLGEFQLSTDSTITTHNSMLESVMLTLFMNMDKDYNSADMTMPLPMRSNWIDFPLPAGKYNWLIGLADGVDLSGDEQFCFTIKPNQKLSCSPEGSTIFPQVSSNVERSLEDSNQLAIGTLFSCELTVPFNTHFIEIEISTQRIELPSPKPLLSLDIYQQRPKTEKLVYSWPSVPIGHKSAVFTFSPEEFGVNTFWVAAFLSYTNGPGEIFYRFSIAERRANHEELFDIDLRGIKSGKIFKN